MTKYYTDVEISIPTSINEYNELSYIQKTIKGKIVKEEQEYINANKETILSKSKLYTNEILPLNTKIDNYLIVDTRECQTLDNITNFYIYLLK